MILNSPIKLNKNNNTIPDFVIGILFVNFVALYLNFLRFCWLRWFQFFSPFIFYICKSVLTFKLYNSTFQTFRPFFLASFITETLSLLRTKQRKYCISPIIVYLNFFLSNVFCQFPQCSKKTRLKLLDCINTCSMEYAFIMVFADFSIKST